MNDEIWIMKQSTMLKLERELPQITRDEPDLGMMARLMYMPKIVAVPDHYLINDIAVPSGYSKEYIMKKFYSHRSKKSRIKKKWFKRFGVKHL